MSTVGEERALRHQALLARIICGTADLRTPSVTAHFAAAGRLWASVVGSTGAHLVSVAGRCLETGAVRQVFPHLDKQGRPRFRFSKSGSGYGVVDVPPLPELRSTIRLFGEDWMVEEVAPDGRWPEVTLACPSLVLGRVSWALVGWLAQLAVNLPCGGLAIERLYRSTVVVDGVKLGFRVLRTALVEAAEVVTVGDVAVKVRVAVKIRGEVPTETRYERAFWARVREGDALAPEVVARREARAHVLPAAADSAIVADQDLGYQGVYSRAPAPAVPPASPSKRGWAEELGAGVARTQAPAAALPRPVMLPGDFLPLGLLSEQDLADQGLADRAREGAEIRVQNRLRVRIAARYAPRAARDGFGRRRGPGWESYQRFLAGLLDAANDRPDPAALPADLAAEVGLFDYPPTLFLSLHALRARAGADASSRARRVEDAPPPEVTVPAAAPSPDAWTGGLLGSVLPCDGFASAKLGVGNHVLEPLVLGPGRRGEIARLTFAVEWDRPCNVQGAEAIIRLCRESGGVIARWAVPVGGSLVHEFSVADRVIFLPGKPLHFEIAGNCIDAWIRVAVSVDWVVRRTDGPRVSGGIAKVSCLPGHEVAIQLPSLPAKITRIRFVGAPTHDSGPYMSERALVVHRGLSRSDRYVTSALGSGDGSVAETREASFIVCEGERLLLRVHPARNDTSPAARIPVTVECDWEEA